MLAELNDDAFIEVQIKASRKTRALFPVGFLRRYLAAQSVPGRQVLVFDSDEEVSSEVAASMLGVSRPHLTELLDAEAIPYRRVGNQRRIRVVDLNAYRERRDPFSTSSLSGACWCGAGLDALLSGLYYRGSAQRPPGR
jgi:excisionase family DNA binding protein